MSIKWYPYSFPDMARMSRTPRYADSVLDLIRKFPWQEFVYDSLEGQVRAIASPDKSVIYGYVFYNKAPDYGVTWLTREQALRIVGGGDA